MKKYHERNFNERNLKTVLILNNEDNLLQQMTTFRTRHKTNMAVTTGCNSQPEVIINTKEKVDISGSSILTCPNTTEFFIWALPWFELVNKKKVYQRVRLLDITFNAGQKHQMDMG